MDENGIPSPDDAANVMNAATGLTGAIQRLLPGISRRSEARAESKITKRTMDDMDAARSWGKEAGLSDKSIEVLCNDIYRRNTRAERLDRVIEFAKEDIDEGAELHVPEESWAEEFQEHAEKACDEEMQRMWGAILAGEMEEPGSTSKRAMDILAKMSKEEADIFRKLCGFTTCIYDLTVYKAYTDAPIPVLRYDDSNTSFNDQGITVREIGILDSMGLVKEGFSTTLSLSAKGLLSFFTNSGVVLAMNEEDTEKKITFGGCTFLPAGCELARVCGIGQDARLMGTLLTKLEKDGLRTQVLALGNPS